MYCLVFLLLVSKSYLAASSGVTVGILPHSHPVDNQYYSQDGLGSYVYGYITPHSSKTEFRTHDGLTKGGYSYIDPNGEIQTVEYTADSEHGFRVATTNLPKDDPEVAYAKLKHFEEFERIKAQHAALAAEHAALAAELASLAAEDWTEISLEKRLRYSYGHPQYYRTGVNNNENAWYGSSSLEEARKKHEEAYKAALEIHRQTALAHGHDYHQLEAARAQQISAYQAAVDAQRGQTSEGGQIKWEETWEAQKARDQLLQTQESQEGDEKWEDTWEAQKLRDQQGNYETFSTGSQTGWTERANVDHIIEQHRAAYESVINAERNLIARAQEERNRQLQAYQQAQQSYRDSVLRLEEIRKQQTTAYGESLEAHREAARRLEEARAQHEEAERALNDLQNSERYNAKYGEAINTEKELVARVQEERDRQLQAYQQALQHYRESEARLEQVRNQQSAAYDSALQTHREASKTLEQVAAQRDEAERNWNSIQNSDQHRAAYQAAIRAESELIARAKAVRDRQLQAYQQALQAYRDSVAQLEESKEQNSATYESALHVHREAAEALEQAKAQQEAERNWQNTQKQSWNYQNADSNGNTIDQATAEHLRIVEATKARNRALAEAERAFTEFSNSINVVAQPIQVAAPKLYAPLQLTETPKGDSKDSLSSYSYGSLKVPEIKDTGGYSFIDGNGVLQTMQYVSDHLRGFRISDVNSALQSAKGNSEGKTTAVSDSGSQVTPQRVENVHQEEEQQTIESEQEGKSWNGDGASYSTEIEY